MEQEAKDYLGWTFWLMWVLANSVAWLVGMSALWILSFILGPLVQGVWKTFGWAVAGSLIGAFFGVNHWFLIRPLGARTIGKWAHWWFLATIAGWGLAIMIILGLGIGNEMGFAVTGAIIGISVGIPQWFVLRPYAHYAEWWAVVNTVGWIIGLALLDWMDRAVGFPLVGVVSSTITGVMIIWLLRKPRGAASPIPSQQ